MGWFGKKEQERRDPRTGQISVKVGDTWVEIPLHSIVQRDLSRYFREKGIGFGDSIGLTAWVSGFMLGTALAVGNIPDSDPQATELVENTHKTIAKGIAEGRAAQDPDLIARYKAAGGKL
jgi:hypothetical protein